MKKLLLIGAFAIMALTSVFLSSAFAEQEQEVKMVPLRAYAEKCGAVVRFELTGGYIPQVFVFTEVYQNGKDYNDLFQFAAGRDVAYKNGAPFTMPAAAYIGPDDRMYVPESVAEMLK